MKQIFVGLTSFITVVGSSIFYDKFLAQHLDGMIEDDTAADVGKTLRKAQNEII